MTTGLKGKVIEMCNSQTLPGAPRRGRGEGSPSSITRGAQGNLIRQYPASSKSVYLIASA